LHGGEKDTTNNRMEILAAIKGLETVPASVEVTVFSDSQYVVNTMTRNWKRNANKDLWARLDTETRKRRVQWRWVRGHDGNPLNEEADALANGEANAIDSKSRRTNQPKLTHVDQAGQARMVDVGPKPDTKRIAVARGSVAMKLETLVLVESNGFDKGDVLGVARIAGIMGAKSTPQLIPMCHPLPLDHVGVEFEIDRARSAVDITATAETTAKTGVEMEAMTAVGVAALTIYDMCKAVDRGMRIEAVRLVRKSGGSSGDISLEDG
jgi:cyclic pyranopterin phosphate synthase